MAISLASLQDTGPNPHPITLLYAVEKVGKTTLAAEFPSPVFLRTQGERPPAGIKVPSWELKTFADFMDTIEVLFTEEHNFATLCVDAADGLEKVVFGEACSRNGWPNIEAPGYGKGYVEAEGVWLEVIEALENLRDAKAMKVVLIAHAETFRFDSPTSDPYARYRPNLHKKSADLLQAASDIIAFINYRVSIKKEDVGFNKEVTRGEGQGLRVIYLEERPGFIAGNRYGMPAQVQFKKGAGYAELSKYLPEA